MNEFFNRESETAKRRQLRGSMPDAEVILWSKLKGRQLLGCKFRRQYSVGSFVIDFYSVEVKLGIELDGDSHFETGSREYDKKRQQFIESFGIRIVRVLNTEIYENLDGVMEMIGREVMDRRENGKKPQATQRTSSTLYLITQGPPPLPPLRKGGKEDAFITT
jgi:very-short-patch-repair endonuclease